MRITVQAVVRSPTAVPGAPYRLSERVELVSSDMRSAGQGVLVMRVEAERPGTAERLADQALMSWLPQADVICIVPPQEPMQHWWNTEV